MGTAAESPQSLLWNVLHAMTATMPRAIPKIINVAVFIVPSPAHLPLVDVIGGRAYPTAVCRAGYDELMRS